MENYREIFSNPLDFPTNKMHINDGELPSVTNKISVTLRLNVQRHDTGWQSIFQKGGTNYIRTPSLWLRPNTGKLHPNSRQIIILIVELKKSSLILN
ncbi:18236_t:CDS:2 [Acaulospora morrowiae]|uniref:18236_t:CDS:1 n=1 Tax=Acaulospora morrowiae TaxID=94023 RepID=A0A9N9B8H3_9GLOM|nr:18236_t:CDS:2 [Acaulospora morrowiae]